MKNTLTKSGSLGTLFTALCCFGTPALLAFLTSIGLAFIINDAILFPMLIFSLGLSAWSLWKSSQKHHIKKAFTLHLASSLILVVFIFGVYVLPVAILGMIGVFAAAIWDSQLTKIHCAC